MNILLILLLPIISIIGVSLLRKNSLLVKYLPISINILSLILLLGFITNEQLLINNSFDSLNINLYTLIEAFNINMSFEITRMSILLLTLAHLTILTAFFSTIKISERLLELNILISLISIGIYGLIISNNLFVFFLFYEIAAIPIFLMISNWGYNLKREISGPFKKILTSFGVGSKKYASYKITIYLFIASILIFFGLAMIAVNIGSFEISIISKNLDNSILTSPIVFLMLIIGFGCHSALWPFHTWAPDGHGSAPTAGSIIFAGVLMKIGLIGFIKIIIPLMPQMVIEYRNLIIILASINVLYGALTAMRQDDLKYMAAYASLSHIGYIFIALMTSNSTGINGGLIQIVSHGLIICLLFFCVGSIHKLKGTRSIKELSSMLDNSPILSYFFIFTAFASIGFPLTSGFIAEFLIINGIHEFSYDSAYRVLLLFVPIIGIFFTTIYMFRAVKNCCFRYNENGKSIIDFSRHEIVICLILVTVILIIGVFPTLIQDLLGNSYERLLLK